MRYLIGGRATQIPGYGLSGSGLDTHCRDISGSRTALDESPVALSGGVPHPRWRLCVGGVVSGWTLRCTPISISCRHVGVQGRLMVEALGRRMATSTTARATFITFVEEVEPRLSFALAAAYGPEVGREATADALMYAWEHWDRLSEMDNAAGYLYRVGQTNSKRHRRTGPVCPPVALPRGEPWIEPDLPNILESLPERQRVAVVLIHGLEWTQQEVADLLGVSRTTVERHLERGMRRLRVGLEVGTDA